MKAQTFQLGSIDQDELRQLEKNQLTAIKINFSLDSEKYGHLDQKAICKGQAKLLVNSLRNNNSLKRIAFCGAWDSDKKKLLKLLCIV